ncbi:MAG: 1,4-alpha-glucan branching protein GlgB [Clostridia bacterium]|nr:1,4-alpha-glucan branching protein GlgB [Clostridia bacterium]
MKTTHQEGELAPYLFHQGTNFTAYSYLGVHPLSDGSTVFRVWAPNADSVSVVGDFCDWNVGIPMSRITERGIWEVTVTSGRLHAGQPYKYRIQNGGKILLKADPYARATELPPATASKIPDETPYVWRDDGWMAYRARTISDGGYYKQPINIYELHPLSWKLHEDGSYLTWIELAEELAPYVKRMGYTHIELMPVMEHPYDGSWGYQVCSYFAPTARLGSPNDFRAFIDMMHEAGIGVILDWVPAHFPKDAHGLYEFDGQLLYEYQGEDRMEHSGWGTRCFDVGRQEVQSFLISSATYWIEEFHADGLRVDAVASMLYLDYDREPGKWHPNVYGNNRNLEAIAFFQKLNAHLHGAYPDVLTIAEESGDFGGVTSSTGGGLGFSMKWNMGWMNDTLAYAELDPIYRKYHHNKTTFSLTYSFHEKYVLPISHDEVVHGKKSFLDRMPGTYEQKFAGQRVFYAWQMTHPGKKLTFMSSEIGQFREWDYAGSVEWFMTDYPMHAAMQQYFAAINAFYLQNPALWQRDDGWDGFAWVDADDAERSILSFRRNGDNGADELLILLNFTPVFRENFGVNVPHPGEWEIVFCSDEQRFGGLGLCPMETHTALPAAPDSEQHYITLPLPPLSAVILRSVPTPKKATRRAPRKTSKTADSAPAKAQTKSPPEAATSRSSNRKTKQS